MSSPIPLPPISEQIWDQKYRLKRPDGTIVDRTLADTWARVAKALAAPEAEPERDGWARRFEQAMVDFALLPAGRIIAGAGTGRGVTLFNCFVMGRVEDDLTAIFDNVKEAALTMQQGGGIGHDFSTLRPAGALVRSVGAGASGPVSFMDVWDAMCRTIMSAGQRRGAMMATLRCDHPDIETFIDAKSNPQRLRNFNLSVLVTDAFVQAVRADAAWDLKFEGTVFRSVRARALWDRIMRATYDYAEPGVIFIDRINAMNNLAYCEDIRATNPCGEQPLPPYGACLLGSINLARLVRQPFTPAAELDERRLGELVPVAVRLLDNAIDISGYPLPQQRDEAQAKRRIGLGVTGLADALIMCGIRYGSGEAIAVTERWMSAIKNAAYLASAELAAEKGPFPRFEAERFVASPFVASLPEHVRAAIAKHGIRNGCLTSIAPTGTISLLAANVSSGVEPVFDFRYTRRVREAGDSVREEAVEDYAHALYRRQLGADRALTDAFVTTDDLSPRAHLEMQAALQRHTDSSISKTINCPQDLSFEAFKSVYLEAYDLGLKGCTTFRPNAVTGSVLASGPASAAAETATIGAATEDAGRIEVVAGLPERVVVAGEHHGDVVYMAKPLERDAVLGGYTYKLKWGVSDHAIYVTINDIERDGRRRPFEVFINTKNLEHYAWTVALTRMISAVFRRGGDVTFVVDELKAIFDPQGGHWMNGRYVPSLLAAIGEVIEAHMLRIGFLQKEEPIAAEPAVLVGEAPGRAAKPDSEPRPKPYRQAHAPRRCPRCQAAAFLFRSGCWICRDCGYSKCG